MSFKKKLLAALLAGVSVFGGACSNDAESGDGVAEETGESVDEGVEDAGDGLEEAGDEAEEATDQ